MQEWSRLEKDTARVIFVGDFNRVDETHPTLWNAFLTATSCVDIDPKLITYYSQATASPLDRCLLPAEWISSASWNPGIRTLHPISITGHKILRVSMQLKPSVVNNPKDPKHEMLPTDLFMPGKHPNEAKQADIQALVQLIHRETNADPHCTKCYRSLTFSNDHVGQELSRERSLNVGAGSYSGRDGLNRSSLPIGINPTQDDTFDLAYSIFPYQPVSGHGGERRRCPRRTRLLLLIYWPENILKAHSNGSIFLAGSLKNSLSTPEERSFKALNIYLSCKVPAPFRKLCFKIALMLLIPFRRMSVMSLMMKLAARRRD